MGGFASVIEPLGDSTLGLRFRATSERRELTLGEVVEFWKTNPEFRATFAATLAAVPYEGMFWETPPTREQSLGKRFECVVTSGSALRRRADPTTFTAHFKSAKKGVSVIAFPNLGGDAELVVPLELPVQGVDYAHLAAFLRTAPRDQVDALWRVVGETVDARLQDQVPFWLSTAGLGVPWLHVRLDSKPKYYVHAPYKELA